MGDMALIEKMGKWLKFYVTHCLKRGRGERRCIVNVLDSVEKWKTVNDK